MKLHFICNNLIFIIENKKYEDNNAKSESMQIQIKENLELNSKINKEMIETQNKLRTIQEEMTKMQNRIKITQDEMKNNKDEMIQTQKEMIQTKDELKDIKNQINTILATIISIVLSISIISSAIIGIEHINSNYILPYVSSLIFFGMIMIAFIFSIYKNKIENRNWYFIISMGIIAIILWNVSISSVVIVSNPNIDNQNNSRESLTDEQYSNSKNKLKDNYIITPIK